MKFLYKKRYAYLFLILITLVGIYLFSSTASGNPSFYLGTDRSFSSKETPYVNLEGSLNNGYEFRVYRVSSPEKFLADKVVKRYVREESGSASGNPIAMFKSTFNRFKKEFRTIARKELNFATRSSIKKAAGVDFKKSFKSNNIAMVAPLKGHEILFNFSIEKGNSSWAYKRIPVPVKDDGVYLVEAVSGSNIAYTLIVKSNLNFITKQSDNSTLIFVAHRETGEPMKDTNVVLYDSYNKKKVFSRKTDKYGIVRYKGKTPEKSLILASSKTRGYAISDPDFYAKSFYGLGGVRAYIYSDRPVYKPGDEVNFKGIVRAFTSGRYRAVGGDATYEVFTENNDQVLDSKSIGIDSTNGTFNGKFNLPSGKKQYRGIYYIVLNYRGKSYSTEFSVQSYKKPPFFVNVKSTKKTYAKKDKVIIEIKGKYFHGASLSDKKFKCRVFRKLKYDFSPVGAMPFFVEAGEYLGLDSSHVKKELVLEKMGELNSDGKYSFSFTPEKIDNDYTYVALASVTADDFTLSSSASFSVNRSLFYIKLEKDKTVFNPGDKINLKARLIPFDKNNIKFVNNRSIKAELFTRSFKNISAESTRVSISEKKKNSDKAGTADFTFDLEKSGHYIVKLSGKDANGDDTQVETAFWVSGKNDNIQVPFKNLTIKPDKDIYSVGDVAEVLIMSPVSDGNLFISLEGSKIYSHETISFKGNSYKYRVKIKPEMSPNFTLSASQFSGGDIYKSEVKIVSPPQNKFLKVSIKPGKKIYKPGDMAQLKISTKSLTGRGVSSEVSVAVVDEAVYQIEQDKTPPISTYFYHPRRNNVNTTLSDAYRFFGYSEEKRLKLALNSKRISPLASIKDSQRDTRERFKDTCFWSARVKTDSQGNGVVKVPLADNLTTWRVTAIAVTPDTRVGMGKTKFLARKDLMIRGILPAFIVKGEKQKLGAVITNSSKKDLNIKSRIVVKGATISGTDKFDFNLKKGDSKNIYVDIDVSSAPTNEKLELKFTALGGKFSDTLKKSISYKTPGLRVSEIKKHRLDSGDDDFEKEFQLPEKFDDAKIKLFFTQGGEEALRQSLFYLVGYPYGCIEQTMSRFMPLLAVKKAKVVDPLFNKNLNEFVDEGLRKIGEHQKPDGGFVWYGGEKSDHMMTAYVYRGLVICKKLFKGVDNRAITKARRYLYRVISKGKLNYFEKSYILSSLSEGGKIEKSILTKMKDKMENSGAYAKALLSLSFYNSGYKDEAMEIYKEALDDSDFKGEDKILFSEKPETLWKNDRVEIASTLLMAAVRLERDKEEIEDLTSLILYNRRGLAWKNSRDSAMAVLAISEKLQRYSESNVSSEFNIIVNDKTVKNIKISPDSLSKKLNVLTFLPLNMKSGENEIKVEKVGGEYYDCSVLLSYYSVKDKYEPVNQGIKVNRKYYRVKTERTDEGLKLEEDETSDFEIGDLVMVEVNYSTSDNFESYIMIEDPLSPGFQVERQDKEYYSSERRIEYSSRQIFDDRVAFFIKGPARSGTIRYFLRVGIPGDYRVTPARASLMYYPDKSGSSAGNSVKIGK